MPLIRKLGLIGGPLLFLIASQFSAPDGLSWEGWLVLMIGVWMAIWWVTESVPIAVTALIPLVLLPLLDLEDLNSVANSYASSATFLPLGGFIIGVAMQRWNLHTRIALHIVQKVGTEPRRVIAGFMAASAFLSMWITNTATTVMMLPIAIPVAMLLMDESKGEVGAGKGFGIALMLGLAYSSTIGGMMTLVGTSTNVMFKGYFEQNYNLEIEFLDWMMMGVPIGLCLLVSTWWLLTRLMLQSGIKSHSGVRAIIDSNLNDLGIMSVGEKRTIYVFLLTVALWIGHGAIEPLFLGIKFNDASIAILGALLLFVIPADWSRGVFLLKWSDTRDVPWGILILLWGGLALAGALNDFGVADWLGGKIAAFDKLPVWLIFLVTVSMIVFLSELMSNVATLAAFLPVIVVTAIGFGQDPLLLAIPAAFAASCAFMLPVATPPNAIVFGSNLLTISAMVKVGFFLNLIAILLLSGASYFLVSFVFGVELGVIPDWATTAPSLPD